jgi:hypothetical protein
MKFANELEMKKQLRQLYEQGCTESDLEDFAFDNDVDMGQVFRIVAEWSAPAACKGCSHIQCYGNMYPCNCCSNHEDIKNRYEPEKSCEQ